MKSQKRIYLFPLILASLAVFAFASEASGAVRTLEAALGGSKAPDVRITGAWKFGLYEKGRRAGSFELRISPADGKGGAAYAVRMDTTHTSAENGVQAVSLDGTLTAEFHLLTLTRVDRRYAPDGKLSSEDRARLEFRGEDAVVVVGEGKAAAEARIEKPGALTVAPAVVFALAKAASKADREAGVVFRALPLETLRTQTLALRPAHKALPLVDAGRSVYTLGDGSKNLLEFVVDADGNVVRFGPPESGIEFRREEK